MAEAPHLDWFRERLRASAEFEPRDPQPILDWRNELLTQLDFSAELIGLAEARGWELDEKGNVVHQTRQFFSVEAVRITKTSLREVSSWDQPIFNQPEGGVLALVARETSATGVEFLLQAKAEPGNIGWLQFCPTIQCTWSNLKRAHKGRHPPLAELLVAEKGVRLIYQAEHNEEGGRFWRKSNDNRIILVADENLVRIESGYFQWVSLSQIKGLALKDNLLSPFVKTIIAPL
jgi:dTDP-4-dehydro-6-deoxy-alpha-D-glucopyranose 2,3-dehydratase